MEKLFIEKYLDTIKMGYEKTIESVCAYHKKDGSTENIKVQDISEYLHLEQYYKNLYLRHIQLNKLYTGMQEGYSELYAILQIWYNKGHEVFVLGQEFSDVLKNIKLNIESKYIPVDEKIINIELPFYLKIDDTQYTKSIFMNVTSGKDILCADRDLLTPQKILRIYCMHDSRSVYLYDVFTLAFKDENETIEDCINNHQLYGKNSPEVIKYIMNAYLYIHSGQPDLREWKPTIIKTKKQKKIRRLEKENLASIPVTLVGFDYKKQKIYSVESSETQGHFRWQPYGEKRDKIKLIWIDNYTRHFNNTLLQKQVYDRNT